MVELRNCILIQYFMYILEIPLLFHGLANRFHNSILSIARGSLVARILGFSLVLQTSGFASIAVARR